MFETNQIYKGKSADICFKYSLEHSIDGLAETDHSPAEDDHIDFLACGYLQTAFHFSD